MLEADTVRLSKADFVYNRLRASIINGDRRPGDFLDKTELGREFGSSRQPLASALDRLAGDGLVKVIPQHGSFVSKLDAAQIRGRFFVRRAIEVEYVLELSGKVTDALIERLDLNLRYQRVALDAGDYDGMYDLDQRFHEIMHAEVAIDEARRVLERAKAYLSRVRRMMLPEEHRANHTYNEHVTIRDALERRDVPTAAAAMRAHMDAVECHFSKFVVKRPELFENDDLEPATGRK